MKTYIKPISKSIKVETENLLADSLGVDKNKTNNWGNAKSLNGDEWDFDGVEE